uniref:Uncharacterized protein n=1 Tax=Romanomermis culicivorax TaxID=13658 RepID=A0A915L927_ROMCU
MLRDMIDNAFSQKMMDKFRNEQLIDDDFYASIRDSLEGMRGTERHFADVRGQYVITGRINMVDTTAVEGDPKSISWSYALCKVAVNSLRKEEQRSGPSCTPYE